MKWLILKCWSPSLPSHCFTRRRQRFCSYLHSLTHTLPTLHCLLTTTVKLWNRIVQQKCIWLLQNMNIKHKNFIILVYVPWFARQKCIIKFMMHHWHTQMGWRTLRPSVHFFSTEAQWKVVRTRIVCISYLIRTQ